MNRKSAYILFLAVLGLLVIGIVMLFSTSAFARDSHGDVYFFIKRQAMWFGVGLVVCIFAALIDYHLWQRTWWLWFALAVAILTLCYVPHIGMRLNGSRRWIGLGPLTLQPSELAKLLSPSFSLPGLRDMNNPTANCFWDLFFRWRSSACRPCLCSAKSIWERRL
jgi:cell division protein FtsW